MGFVNGFANGWVSAFPSVNPTAAPLWHQPTLTDQIKCECISFLQFYVCGCPDLGFDTHGRPRRTEKRCHVFQMDIFTQDYLARLGFQHAPKADNRVRILPFPCLRHMLTSRTYVAPQQIEDEKTRVLDARNSAFMTARANRSIREQQRAQITTATNLVLNPCRKRPRAQFEDNAPSIPAQICNNSSWNFNSVNGNIQGQNLPPPGNKRARMMREARKATISGEQSSFGFGWSIWDDFPLDVPTRPHTHNDNFSWLKEEQAIDLDELDGKPRARCDWIYRFGYLNKNFGNPFHPRYERHVNKGYDNGAYIITPMAIEQAQHATWWKLGNFENDWLLHAVLDDALLDM
ncbi:hypothetical protein QBC46DRAFT_427560 [Diplogelasinospora grovesii]|uniref:Uncharacterized protein n=1 Tax=Diplogelasinospora grovesii TaxID=303347 RepID=A0AAN6MXM8_9PEZI|nr:hypothetical protein QBC46DRAFT_427560 [Diplogelasinospora grovesii]